MNGAALGMETVCAGSFSAVLKRVCTVGGRVSDGRRFFLKQAGA